MQNSNDTGSAPEVMVVRTGTANLASVLAGLRRAGANPQLTDSADDVTRATHVMLPGVGAFAASMGRLQEQELVEALRQRMHRGASTLSICVGLQLLCESSEESPGARGLGVVPCEAKRFPETVRVPQLGWNQIEPTAGCRLLQAGWAYFANSYRLVDAPEGWHVAFAEHGGRFVAAMEKGAVLACQFHPELSGAFGQELLQRWLACAESESSAAVPQSGAESEGQ